MRSPAVPLCCLSLLMASGERTLAQQTDACTFLCAPSLKIEPTVTVEHLGPRTHVEIDGRRELVERETVVELIVALEVPTEIPRLGLTFEAIFVPAGRTSVNPFTGVSAEELGRSSIRDNPVEIESELNIGLVGEDQTAGWISSHFDIVDKFSPAKRPSASSTYTHKLNFELDTAFHVFKELSEDDWLHRVELELSLDYLATGLPRAGDVVNGERFLDRASPWSLSFVVVLPLVPLAP